MSNRIGKQIIFGTFYLILLLAIGYGFYFFAIRPAPICFDNRQNQGEEGIDCGGPCQSCAVKNLESLGVFLQPQLLPLDERTAAVYFQLKNPNSLYGADKFSYVLNFYNAAGEKIQSLTDTSFIYAGKIKTIIEAPVKIEARRVVRIETAVSDVSWRSAVEFPAPNLQSRSVKVEVAKNQAKVTGLVLNNNSFKLSTVQVGVVLADKSGFDAAASKTVLKDLSPFEERAFTVFLPLAGQTIDSGATLVFTDGLK